MTEFIDEVPSVRPLSNVFTTVKDSDGVNRLIIDTSEKPWCDLLTLSKLYDVCYSVIGNMDDSPQELFYAYVRVHGARLNFVEPAIIDDDDSIAVLWAKVVDVESVLHEFLHFTFFVEFLLRMDETCNLRIGEYIRIFDYVRAHTSGPLHVIAKKMTYTHSCLAITSMARGQICSICYEHGRNAHMCITKRCGHIFHLDCHLKVQSPECPCCRSLE